MLLTENNDVVLDPFLGGGTTFRVEKALGRIPVGIEIDEGNLVTFENGTNESHNEYLSELFHKPMN